jgi:hypothetical protein
MKLDELEWEPITVSVEHPIWRAELPKWIQLYRIGHGGRVVYSMYWQLDGGGNRGWYPGIGPLEAQCLLYHLAGVTEEVTDEQ